MRIAQVSPLFESVPPKLYGGTERVVSFLTEALMLALAAGIIGIILAMPIDGLSTTFGNFVTFSTLAFSFQVTPRIMLEAIIFAAVMGVFGGWLPARQAMRMRVVDALRSV